MMSDLRLGFDLDFSDLYEQSGLSRIDHAFIEQLAETDQELANRLLAARAAPDLLENACESELLTEIAPHLEDFIAELFGILLEMGTIACDISTLAPLYTCKRLFVQRRVTRAFKPEQVATLDGVALTAALATRLDGISNGGIPNATLDELVFARNVTKWLQDEGANADALALAESYAAWALYTTKGRERHGSGILFQVPHKIDHNNMVPIETVDVGGVTMMRIPHHHQRPRHGFDLSDCGTDLAGALDQANYCIWCHKQGKDSCSKGLRDRKTGAFQKSPFGVALSGCPLEQKVSEIHTALAKGQPVGALAIAIIDNPMIAGTGHRICNDCMKACIYQKQERVDIPQAETRTLKTVLDLPWGFEIYGLLTRWNPLNLRRPVARPESGYKVLIVGLGPAGYTLSHYL
ncbi:MAG: pyridine nucleotide-disulfide oxidoreductase, partial [Rhodospirillaceae bacterium]